MLFQTPSAPLMKRRIEKSFLFLSKRINSYTIQTIILMIICRNPEKIYTFRLMLLNRDLFFAQKIDNLFFRERDGL